MTPRRFKCSQFCKGTLDFNFESIRMLQNDFVNNNISHKMQLPLAKTEFARKPICAELFLLSIHKYTKFEQNIPCGRRVMNIFTQRAQSARMMLDEASSPFCIPVAGQC